VGLTKTTWCKISVAIWLNTRICRVAALPVPNDRERIRHDDDVRRPVPRGLLVPEVS